MDFYSTTDGMHVRLLDSDRVFEIVKDKDGKILDPPMILKHFSVVTIGYHLYENLHVRFVKEEGEVKMVTSEMHDGISRVFSQNK